MSWLDTPILGELTLEDLMIFLLILVIGGLIGKIVSLLIRRYLDERIGRRQSKLLARIAMYTIILGAIIVGFDKVLQQELTGLIVSLGFVGVAIAFASQQIIQNMLSGILISIVRPIQLEDWVEVGSMPSTGLCRVKDIKLMNTELRDIDGRIVTIPNSQVLNGKVINYTQAGFVALRFDLWVKPSSDLETIKRIVYEEALADPRVLPGVREEDRGLVMKLLERPSIKGLFGPGEDLSALNPQVNILDLRESKMRLHVRVWIKEIHRRDEILSDLISVLRRRMDAMGITLLDP